MILQSINLFIESTDDLDALFASDSVKDIIAKHKHMGIDQGLVAIWKDSLIDTIAQFDCEFNNEL